MFGCDCELKHFYYRVTIDRGYGDVMKLNKQLSDCALEIEEHSMKLQLLNKQLKIAKESLESAQAKQQEIKNKVYKSMLTPSPLRTPYGVLVE